MDYPLAFTIALPSSTFIVTCGALVGKYLTRNSSNGGVSRRILDGILHKKFEKVVYDDTFKAEIKAIRQEVKLEVKGIHNEMELTRKALEKGLEDIREEIRSSR